MAFDLPLLTDQVDVAIATKTAGSLTALRDGSATHGGTSTGAANVYDCVFTPVFTAYTEPVVLTFRAHQDNTGSATFKADALAAITMKKYARGLRVNLDAGDIKLNQVVQVLYHAVAGVAVLLNPTQITDGLLSSNVPLKDVANVFPANQEIEKADAAMLLDATTGVPRYQLSIAGVLKSSVVAEGSDEIEFYDSSNAQKVRWVLNGADGKLTRGIVPLARMGARFFASGSTATTDLNIGTVSIGDILIVHIKTTASISISANLNLIFSLGVGNVATFASEPSPNQQDEVSAGTAHGLNASGILRVTGAGTAVIRSLVQASAGVLTVTLNEIGTIRYLNS